MQCIQTDDGLMKAVEETASRGCWMLAVKVLFPDRSKWSAGIADLAEKAWPDDTCYYPDGRP